MEGDVSRPLGPQDPAEHQRRDGNHKEEPHYETDEAADAQLSKLPAANNDEAAGVAHTGGCLQARQAGCQCSGARRSQRTPPESAFWGGRGRHSGRLLLEQ